MADDQNLDELSPLLRAAQQGDKGSLGRLLRQLWPWLRRKAGALLSRPHAPMGVSSLAQETALRFSRKIEKTRSADSPAVKALLHRIMKNAAHDAYRAKASAKRDPSRQFLSEHQIETGDSIADQLEHIESLHRLHAAIVRLPDRQREAILLLLEDVAIDDIAKRLQCSPGAVHMLIQRAKCQLTAWLAESGPAATQ